MREAASPSGTKVSVEGRQEVLQVWSRSSLQPMEEPMVKQVNVGVRSLQPMESSSSWVAVAACGAKPHSRTVLEGLQSMERSLTRTGERVRRKEQNVIAVKD